jgi:PAS domain S-box-containing protein
MRVSSSLDSALIPRWRLSIRAHLVVLVLAALLPVLLFATILVVYRAREERAAIENGMRDTARALATAVDRELASSITALRAFAASQHLESHDVRTFYEDARRVVATHPNWVAVSLFMPTGAQLLNTLQALGTPLPSPLDAESFERILATGQPVVGSLVRGPLTGAWHYPVRVPVLRDGRLEYVLTAIVSTEAISDVLAAQRLPGGSFGIVFDSRGRIVARSANAERFEAVIADSLLGPRADGPDGWVRGSSAEGGATYTAYVRPPASGWTVALATDAALIDGQLWGSLSFVGAGLVLVLGAALGAGLLARRIAAPLAALAASAESLGRGETPTVASSPVLEVDALARTIEMAGRERREAEALLACQKSALELIATGAPLPKVLEALTQAVEQQSPDAVASILLLDRDGVHLRPVAAPSLPDAYTRAIDGIAIGPDVGTATAAAFRREPVITPDIAEAPGWATWRYLPLSLGLRAAWSMPIFSSTGQVLGTFDTYFREARSPSPRERRTVEILARTASIAIERAQSEVALHESEERYRLVGRAINDVVWDWNVATSEFVWSDALKTVFGYDPQQSVGIKASQTWWIDHIHPDDRQRVRRSFQNAIEAGAEVWSEEYRFRKADGSYAVVTDRGYIRRDSSGRPLRMVGSMLDTTERKRAEEERGRLFEREQTARREAERRRQEAEELVRLARVLTEDLDLSAVAERIVQNVPRLFEVESAVLRLLQPDGSLVVLASTGRAPAIFPRGFVTPPGMGLGARAIAERRPVWTSDIQHEREVVLSEEVRARLASIDQHAVLAAPLVVKGEIFGVLGLADNAVRRFSPSEVGLFQGLADQAALAIRIVQLYRGAEEARVEAEAANRAKDQFLATLSHELRTPLNAMVGWLRMLRGGQLDPERAAHGLDVLERNTQLQAKLVDDLLDVSRIVAGKLQLEKRVVDMAAVVEQVVTSLADQAQAKGVRLSRRLDATAGPVWGDPTRLHQVVANLLSNALKFTPAEGEIEVVLDRHQATVRLSVCDTGQGVEPELLSYIFDRFRQADSTSTRAHGGLGLGLAIVRHLVELHGGTVSAHSEGRNRGATFTVELPVMPVREPIREADGPNGEQLEARAPAHLAGVRVLVVDDHADSGEMIGMVLEHAGAEVQLARSADEALTCLRQTPVDVLVSDLSMPGTDGYQLLGAVRAMERARGTHPVSAVALTAYAGSDDRTRALAIGFRAFASKPIDHGDLVDLVTKAIEVRGRRIPDDG